MRVTPSRLSIWSAMIVIYLVWGSTYLAIRFAVGTIPPFFMAGTRFTIAGLVLLVYRLAAGDPLPTWQEWRGSGVLGLFLLLGGVGVVSWAEQILPSGLAALLVSSSPLWMLVFEALLPHGIRASKRTAIGIAAGFGGILLLFWPGQGSLLNIDPAATIAVLIATFSWALGSVYSRRLRLPASAMMGSAAEMLTGGIALLILSLISGDMSRLNLQVITPVSLFGWGYLIVFGSLVAYNAYTWLLRVAPTSLVSTYAYVNPLVALMLGVLIGNEVLSPRSLLAAAIIVGSVALTTMTRPSAAAHPSPVEPD